MSVGDPVRLRIQKPVRAPAELGGEEVRGPAVELALRVARTVPRSKLGEFDLTVSWSAPLNAFVNLPGLQAATGLEGRVNSLVTGGLHWAQGHSDLFEMRSRVWRALRNLARRTGSELLSAWLTRLEPDESERADTATTVAACRYALERSVELADYEAKLCPVDGGAGVELVSVRRRLLDRPLVEAVLALAPQAPWGHAATALVDDGGNRGRAGSRAISLMGDTALTPDRTGEVLAIRFAVAAGETPEAFVAALGKQILEGVEPEAMGLRFELVRDRALKQLLWWLDPLLWLAGAGAVVTAVRRGGKQRERRAH